jgi:hypothetical protein
MWRTALAVIVGLLAWTIIVTLIDIGLRYALPGYAQAEPLMAFTFTMKIARLLMAAVTGLAAGILVRMVAPQGRWAPWLVGCILLLTFVPIHIQLWPRFPVWYHLSFLLPLAPLVVIGARFGRRGEREPGNQHPAL